MTNWIKIAPIFLLVCNLYSQTSKISELRQNINTSTTQEQRLLNTFALAEAFKPINLDSSLFYNQISLQVARDLNIDSIAVSAAYKLSSIYYTNLSQREKALEYITLGQTFNQELNDPKYTYNLNHTKGLIETEKGQFVKAIRTLLSNYQIASDLDDTVRMARAYNAVADAHRLNKNGEQALEYANKAYELTSYFPEGTEEKKIGLALNLALAYDAVDERDRCIAILEKLEERKDLTSFYKAAIAHNLGRSYNLKEEFVKAERKLRQVLEVDAWMSIPRREIATLKELSTLYLETGNYKSAIELGEDAYELAVQSDIQYHLEDLTRNLSRAYERNEDFEKSLYYQKQYTILSKSIFNRQRNRVVLEMQAKHEAAQKQKEIELLEKERLLAERNSILWILGFAVLLLALVFAILYYRKRNVINQKENDLAKKDKELLAVKLAQEQAQSEKERQEKEIIELELKLKQKELTTNAMSLLQKKEQYGNLINQLSEIKGEATINKQALSGIISEAKASLVNYNWKEFQLVFEKVHSGFYDKLLERFPNITPNEKRLCALLKLGMSSKDISAITHQSVHSIVIARSRLRKKMGLQKDQNLSFFIDSI